MLAPRQSIALHHGEILQELLEEHNLTQTMLATHLGMPQSKINEICRGKRGISPDMAVRLGKVFQQNPMFWLNLQKHWELSQLNEADYASITPLIPEQTVVA